jgi:hypothetical protein
VTVLVAGARWFFWSDDVGLEVVDFPFFFLTLLMERGLPPINVP